MDDACYLYGATGLIVLLARVAFGPLPSVPISPTMALMAIVIVSPIFIVAWPLLVLADILVWLESSRF